MDIEQLLRSEIQIELNKLKEMEVKDPEYKTTVDGIVKLTDKVIEFRRINVDIEEKEKNREAADALAEADRDLKIQQMESDREVKIQQMESEANLKLKQMDIDKKYRLIEICVDVAGIVLPIFVTIWGTKKSFEFEKEGTITTIMGRGFLNKLIPKK